VQLQQPVADVAAGQQWEQTCRSSALIDLWVQSEQRMRLLLAQLAPDGQ
jgi:hypothetical protein